ncbi:MAG TPA: YceI family protein [Acidimicrobiia bacterium]|nr:YceI family protein [Acidimicrobiia bacterium]
MLAKLRSPRVLLVGVVALVALFAVAYFTLFDTESPPEFSLQTQGSTNNAAAPPVGELAGTWTVFEGEAGYRVREKLANLPAPSDAVGRTKAVTGQVTMTGSDGAYKATDASFTVDVSTLKSDSDRRDSRIREIGLETAKFPQATFKSTAPIDIPQDAVEGKAVTVQAEGDMTLHGVTKKVSIPLQVQRNGDVVEIVGNYEFTWADFGMTAPSVPPFVSVTGEPKLEFTLKLSKQA